MSGYHTSVIVDDQETGGPQMSCVSPETDIPPGDGLLKGSEPKAEGRTWRHLCHLATPGPIVKVRFETYEAEEVESC